jgi:Predicted nucleic acid-binding protein, contains PIN domain
VITETAISSAPGLGETYRVRFLEQILSGAVSVFELRLEHGPRLLDLTRRYAALPMDLADASLVILAEHLGHGRILSTDMRDFETYRWKNHHPFKNLLIPEA